MARQRIAVNAPPANSTQRHRGSGAVIPLRADL
jgi:hypothetical protein